MGVLKLMKNTVFKSETKNKVDDLPDDLNRCHQVNLDDDNISVISCIDSSISISGLDSSISSKSSSDIESSNTNESHPKHDLIGITEDIRCQSFVEDYLPTDEINTSGSKSSDWSDCQYLIEPPLDFVCDTPKWVNNKISLEKELELPNSSILDLKDLKIDDCDNQKKSGVMSGNNKKDLKKKTIPEFEFRNSIIVRKSQLDC